MLFLVVFFYYYDVWCSSMRRNSREDHPPPSPASTSNAFINANLIPTTKTNMADTVNGIQWPEIPSKKNGGKLSRSSTGTATKF